MQLKRWNRVRGYLKSSLWVVPLIAIPLGMITTRILHWLDGQLEWVFQGLAVTGARALLDAVITSALSFMVFTFGSLLVAVQVASGQMTPRIIATVLLRNNVVRYTVGLFIFTFMLALGTQDRIDDLVHRLPLFAVSCLGVACFAAFLYLIDYASRLLRPISVLTHVADSGFAVIESVYPEPSLGPDDPRSPLPDLGPADRVILHQGTSGIVLTVDLATLIRAAETSNGVIEFAPQVGDFVAVDEPLFKLYGGALAVNDETLRSTMEFGSERTLEQDPTFAFRIVIDIALKALSPAINDPTTAVLAIDQLHRLLRLVGKRHLRTDEISDASGRLRVIFPTPNWEEFVHLTFSEIRQCGSNNLQIVRRLRAMIENLIQTLPSHRQPALAAATQLARPRSHAALSISGRVGAGPCGRFPGLGWTSKHVRLICAGESAANVRSGSFATDPTQGQGLPMSALTPLATRILLRRDWSLCADCDAKLVLHCGSKILGAAGAAFM